MGKIKRGQQCSKQQKGAVHGESEDLHHNCKGCTAHRYRDLQEASIEGGDVNATVADASICEREERRLGWRLLGEKRERHV